MWSARLKTDSMSYTRIGTMPLPGGLAAESGQDHGYRNSGLHALRQNENPLAHSRLSYWFTAAWRIPFWPV
jgi:hypothetical protein